MLIKPSLISKVVKPSITTKLGRAVLQTQKHSPHILFGAGMVGFVSTTVLASKATLRVEEVLQKTQSDLDNVRMVVDGPLGEKHDYTEDDAFKDRLFIYTRTFVDLSKLYAPTIIVGGLSVIALTKSHAILTQRNTALTAAYVGLDRAYRAYRGRVREVLGEEREEEIYYDYREEMSVDTRELDEMGDDAPIKVSKRIGETHFSPYARFFDESSRFWQKDPEANWLHLRIQQSYANDLLKLRGHLFLNEVYEMLGLDHTSQGAVVGWVISKDGDNYVDFGFMDGERERARAFVNHQERSVLLDFNVDGVIYDKI